MRSLLVLLVCVISWSDAEECYCHVGIVSAESAIANDVILFRVTFQSATECNALSAESCRARCSQGFLKSTNGGDLTMRSRRSSRMIGQLLCDSYGHDVTKAVAGLFYRSCNDVTQDSDVRSLESFCCHDNVFSVC